MDLIGPFILKQKFNAIVSSGGVQSNRCRVVTIFSAMYKLDCTLVLHGDKESFFSQSGNAKIIRDTGVSLFFCE
ncbi:hypothetical protein [Algibacter mikhailovii]|uniref:Uncharacterized protein n=1 Tax=Algibacter mikhailovii TaxID=425498 RepID=A0A918QU10_9FLAO|nr:hypothetical protein [Algibacter mikhailovii]GGZ70441.1 hypothetical protein GCM10007028_04460 [Algibacter mikhailovii]